MAINVNSQTEITSSYILNPSFEDDARDIFNPTRPTGWNHTNNNYGWCGVNQDGNAATKTGSYIFGIWGAQISDFELNQTIINLPKGFYSISCDLMVAADGTNSRMTTQRIFAGNEEIGYKSQYYGLRTSYSSDILATNEDYSFAGYTETVGDASELRTISVILDFPGGDLNIGLRTNGVASTLFPVSNSLIAGAGWFKIDNFRLFSYEESELLPFYKEQLGKLITEIPLISLGDIPLGYESLLSTALSNSQDLLENSNDQSEVIEMINYLNSLTDEMSESSKDFKKLKNIIELATELKNEKYTGYEQLEDATILATNTFDNANSLKDDFVSAITNLESAIFNYRINIVATKDNPIDYTWKISAPHFTNEYEAVNDESQRFMGTWQTEITSEGGDFKLATSGDKNCWNSWSNNFTYMSVYQDIEGLPQGIYTLSCITATDGEVTNQHAFVKSSDEMAISNPPSAENKVTGDFKYTAVWEKIETEKVKVGTDGKLRIGMQSNGTNGTAGWFCVSDFKLLYFGNEKEIPLNIFDIDNNKVSISENNGIITVTGSDNYRIIAINGQEVSKNSKLAKGIYIIDIEGKSYKIVIR